MFFQLTALALMIKGARVISGEYLITSSDGFKKVMGGDVYFLGKT